MNNNHTTTTTTNNNDNNNMNTTTTTTITNDTTRDRQPIQRSAATNCDSLLGRGKPRPQKQQSDKANI